MCICVWGWGGEGMCGGVAPSRRVCGRGARKKSVPALCPSDLPPSCVPPVPLTPVQELRHVALPPQGGATELVVQPQEEI